MRKHGGFLASALLLLLVPSLANAWTLATKVSGNSSDGALYIQDARHLNLATTADLTDYIAVIDGDLTTYVAKLQGGTTYVQLEGAAKAYVWLGEYMAADVLLDYAPLEAQLYPLGYTIPENSQNLSVAWGQAADKQGDVSVIKSAGGTTLVQYSGSSTMTGFTDISFGQTVGVKASPNTDYKVASITITKKDADGLVVETSTTPYTGGPGQSQVLAVLVNQPEITATATYDLVPKINAQLASPLRAVAGAPVTLNANGTTSNDSGLQYAFAVTGSETFSKAASTSQIFTFTPNIAGTLNVVMTVTSANGGSKDKAVSINVVSEGSVYNPLCLGCHTGSTPQVVEEYNDSNYNAYVGCVQCHTSSPHNDPAPATFGGSVHEVNSVSCSDCHVGTHPQTVVSQTDRNDSCGSCHVERTVEELQSKPFTDEIVERFNTSRHANQSARSGACSACHSHEGGVALLSMDRKTSDADLKASYNETVPTYMLLAGSTTTDNVSKKTCTTCHEQHTFALRGDGDITAAMLGATGTTTQEATVVYSAEFNLCTACHMVDVAAENLGTGGNGRFLYGYELSAAYTAANLIDASTGTYVSPLYSKTPFYHDGASGNGRTMADTHFGGTILSHLVDFQGGSDDIVIKGYNINAGAKNACTTCHDPHTGGKMLSIDSSSTIDYADQLDNKVVSYAEGLGDFHNSYQTTVAYRQNGCAPCHSGDDFAKSTFGAAADNAWTWKTLGCRACHDLAVPNAAPGANNAAAFAEVREFPVDHQFAFNSGVVANVLNLGVNQVCFECHKGRTPGVDVAALADPATGTQNYTISYLHYAPSFAILYGNDSQMVATYPGKTYSGRFQHYDGTQFGCVDCHDVHNTDGNHAANNKMNTVACGSCHADTSAMSPAALQARTEAFSIRLLDTVLAEMLAYPVQTGFSGTLDATLAALAAETDPAVQKTMLMEYIQGRTNYFPNKAIAHAATTWKVFTYEDGAPHGQTHGHGGSWAHNSKFARQVMFDAIESLDAAATAGLTRP